VYPSDYSGFYGFAPIKESFGITILVFVESFYDVPPLKMKFISVCDKDSSRDNAAIAFSRFFS